jgi:DNA/RNA-binding domain of Phe-tRNA-synthetase-like protein
MPQPCYTFRVSEGELEEPLLAEGWVDEQVREEFPELRLRTAVVERGSGRTPAEIRQRLRMLSDRFRGAQAIALRRSPIPSAYRVFFRHVGLDPDTTRTPVEEAAVQRLVKGAFQATNLLDDALLIALVETGIPLWAVDADRTREPLGIGTSPDGRLAVCDADGPLATLFGPVDAAHVVTKDTTRMLIYTIQVPSVPPIFVDEAMWTCLGVLQDAG